MERKVLKIKSLRKPDIWRKHLRQGIITVKQVFAHSREPIQLLTFNLPFEAVQLSCLTKVASQRCNAF